MSDTQMMHKGRNSPKAILSWDSGSSVASDSSIEDLAPHVDASLPNHTSVFGRHIGLRSAALQYVGAVAALAKSYVAIEVTQCLQYVLTAISGGPGTASYLRPSPWNPSEEASSASEESENNECSEEVALDEEVEEERPSSAVPIPRLSYEETMAVLNDTLRSQHSGLFIGISPACAVNKLLHEACTSKDSQDPNPKLDITEEDQFKGAQLFVGRLSSQRRMLNAACKWGVFGKQPKTLMLCENAVNAIHAFQAGTSTLPHRQPLNLTTIAAAATPGSIFEDIIKLYIACVYQAAQARMTEVLVRAGWRDVGATVARELPPRGMFGLMGVALKKEKAVEWVEAVAMSKLAKYGSAGPFLRV